LIKINPVTVAFTLLFFVCLRCRRISFILMSISLLHELSMDGETPWVSLSGYDKLRL
jgi:hypothetical protein